MSTTSYPSVTDRLSFLMHEVPRMVDVLEEVGLKMVAEYVGVRREMIAEYVATRPVLDTCRTGTRQRGSSPH